MDNLPKKKPKKYLCKTCDFSSNDKKDYSRHLTTRKHKRNNLDNEGITKKTEENLFKCEYCSKLYKYSSGLSKHKKKVHALEFLKEDNRENKIINKSINKQVHELRKMMCSMVKVQKKTNNSFKNFKKMIPKLGNTTYNQKMSINVYLNQYCKDAINIKDFIENLTISLEDLKYTKEHGYAKGISNIFVKQLKDLKPTERPIHCSDKKRLQFYVKDDDNWQRDTSHQKIDSTIHDITIKQIKQLKEWEKAHPNYLKDEALLKEWHDMVHSIMGGDDDEDRNKNKADIKKELGITFEMKEQLLENHN